MKTYHQNIGCGYILERIQRSCSLLIVGYKDTEGGSRRDRVDFLFFVHKMCTKELRLILQLLRYI